MPPNQYVKVRLECRTRQQTLDLCVPVSRGVPDDLRCSPGGSISASGSGPDICDTCRRLLADSAAGLREAVEDLIRRGWSDHLKAGAVVVRGC